MAIGAATGAAASGEDCDTIIDELLPSEDEDAPAIPAAAVNAIAIAAGATKHARIIRAFMAFARGCGSGGRYVTSTEVSEQGENSFSDLRLCPDLSAYRSVSSGNFGSIDLTAHVGGVQPRDGQVS